MLAPTRELATQIADSFRAYGKHLGVSVAVIFGGVKYGPQIKALANGVDVLVATPGRLIDHLRREAPPTCAAIEIFVLDEADQMLDLGFLHADPPASSPTCPSSARTCSSRPPCRREIGKLAGELLNEPGQGRGHPAVHHRRARRASASIFVEAERKRALLAELFADASRRPAPSSSPAPSAAPTGWPSRSTPPASSAASIHGDKTQGQRERALAAFKAGEVRALVATDIAARGIDVDAVSHVVNYELPNVPEAYVHRIGRTARAGATGAAISLCADDERPLLKDIQKATRQTIPTFDRRNDKVLAQATAEWPTSWCPRTPARARTQSMASASARRAKAAAAARSEHARAPTGGAGPRATGTARAARLRARTARAGVRRRVAAGARAGVGGVPPGAAAARRTATSGSWSPHDS